MKSSKSLILWALSLLAICLASSLQAQILTFQEGVSGYTGTLDTQLRQASPDANAGAAVNLISDQQDGTTPGVAQILLRFDNIIGAGPGQIMPGSLIRGAQLVLYSSAGDAQSGGTISFHRLLQDWTEACTWNSCFAGDGTPAVQADDVEAMVAADVTMVPNFPNPAQNGTQSRTQDVTAVVQAWANGAANFGWVLINSATDGYRMDSSENATAANRPLLRVEAGDCTAVTFTQQPTPANPTVEQCRTVSITAAVSGSTPIALQWNKDGFPIDPFVNPTANSLTLVISNAQASDAGSYTLTAQNECSNPTSAAAVLAVDPDDTAPLLTYAFGAADNTTITLTFSEPMTLTAVDNFNYLVCERDNPNNCVAVNPGTLSPDGRTATLTTSPRTPGVPYTVSFNDLRDACADNLIVPGSIALNTEIVILTADAVTQWRYNHEGVDLSATPWKNVVYDDSSWSNGLAVLAVEDTPPADPALRTVMVLTNANFPLDTARIPTYYFRTHFNFPGDPAAPTSRLKIRTAFDDYAYVYINGVEVYRDIPGSSVGQPELAFTAYTGGTAVGNYAWGPFNYIPLTSTVEGDNVVAVQLKSQAAGSSDVAMAIELVAELPAIEQECPSILDHPDSLTVDEFQPASFSVTADGTSLQYEWQKNGEPIAGAISSTYSIPSVSPSDAGVYRVRVYNACSTGVNSVLSDGATLTVNPKTSDPAVQSVLGLAGETNIVITFSNGPLSVASAQNINNYTVSGGVTVESAVLSANGMQVTLTTTARTVGQNYSLTIQDLTDRAQTPNTINPNPTVIGAIPQELRLVNWHDNWRWIAECLADGWQNPGFDDSSWGSGPAALGVDTTAATLTAITNFTGDGILTPIAAPNAGGSNNHYFRIHFTLPSIDLTGVTWVWDNVRDDGAILYLNGAEVWRRNITNAAEVPVTCTDQASSHEADAFSSPNEVPGNVVLGGDNVVGVWLKQNGTASSDVVWAMELTLIVPEYTAPRPELCITLEILPDGVTKVVTVNTCPGSPSAAGYVLQGADDPEGPWATIPGPLPHVTTPGAAKRFYRLCQGTCP